MFVEHHVVTSFLKQDEGVLSDKNDDLSLSLNETRCLFQGDTVLLTWLETAVR